MTLGSFMFMRDPDKIVNRLKMANVQAIQVSNKQGWSGRNAARLIRDIAKCCGQRRTSGSRFAVLARSRVECQQFTCLRSKYLGCAG